MFRNFLQEIILCRCLGTSSLFLDVLDLGPLSLTLVLVELRLEVQPRLLVGDVRELPLPKLLVVVVHPRHLRGTHRGEYFPSTVSLPVAQLTVL